MAWRVRRHPDGRYRALNAFLGWCETRKDLKRHLYRRSAPMNEVEPPHVPRAEQKAVDFDDWLRLLRAIDMSSWLGARDCLIVTTLFLCGIRVSELIKLCVEDSDLLHGMLKIREGKRGDFELVPLLEPVARAFVADLFVRSRWPTSEICLSADGGWMAPIGVLTRSGVTQLLKRLRKRAGIGRANPQAFRHGLAQYLINDKGADMAFIQQILRHKRITTTAEIYAILFWSLLTAHNHTFMVLNQLTR